MPKKKTKKQKHHPHYYLAYKAFCEANAIVAKPPFNRGASLLLANYYGPELKKNEALLERITIENIITWLQTSMSAQPLPRINSILLLREQLEKYLRFMLSNMVKADNLSELEQTKLALERMIRYQSGNCRHYAILVAWTLARVGVSPITLYFTPLRGFKTSQDDPTQPTPGHFYVGVGDKKKLILDLWHGGIWEHKEYRKLFSEKLDFSETREKSTIKEPRHIFSIDVDSLVQDSNEITSEIEKILCPVIYNLTHQNTISSLNSEFVEQNYKPENAGHFNINDPGDRLRKLRVNNITMQYNRFNDAATTIQRAFRKKRGSKAL